MPSITLADYYMGRDLTFPDQLTDILRSNAQITVERANQLLFRAGMQRDVNSGWRPAEVNATVKNAAKSSKHITCQAIDIGDDDDALDAWCMSHQHILAEIGLWMEHPSATPRWCHVQIVAPKSGNRVFYP